MPGALAPHEALELHEVLRTETLGVIKMQAMLPMVADAELKSLMEQGLTRKRSLINRLREMARTAAGQEVQ